LVVVVSRGSRFVENMKERGADASPPRQARRDALARCAPALYLPPTGTSPERAFEPVAHHARDVDRVERHCDRGEAWAVAFEGKCCFSLSLCVFLTRVPTCARPR